MEHSGIRVNLYRVSRGGLLGRSRLRDSYEKGWGISFILKWNIFMLLHTFVVIKNN